MTENQIREALDSASESRNTTSVTFRDIELTLRRELGMRKNVYTKRIAAGKMGLAQAESEVRIMSELLDLVKYLQRFMKDPQADLFQ